MTLKELIEIRKDLLRQMDDYIRDTIGNDECTDKWNMFGVPDCAEDDIIEFIAFQNKNWVETCTWFGKLIEEYDKKY